MSSEMHWWEKTAVKYGLVIIRTPPERLQANLPEDHVMALHYCKRCKTYRFDRIFDPLSLSETLFCGHCGESKSTAMFYGLSLFYISECAKIANQMSGGNSARTVFKLLRFLFFGINKKHLPKNREGKTMGELETKAAIRMIYPIIMFLSIRD